MARVSVLLPDAGPLFTLAAAEALDLLGAAELDVVLTDEVAFEATRNEASTAASRIRTWLATKPPYLRTVETEIGAVARVARAQGLEPRDLGEESLLNAIRMGSVGPGPYLVLFEDTRLIDPQFFGPRPVHLVSTRAFLVGLERAGAIASADEVWERARRFGRNANPAILDIPSVANEPTEWLTPKKAKPAE
jgi:hypothetical protein